MKITNKLGLPQAIVEACDVAPHNAVGSLSATTLLKGVKQVILEQRHWDEITDDVANRIWAVWGTTVHSLLEKAGDGEVVEENVSTSVSGVKVTGRVDNYNTKTGVITDWKTASIWKVTYADFADWRQQGMIYAWLLACNDMRVSQCRFIALLKDHSATQAAHKADYPQSPVYIYEFPVTADDLVRTEEFVVKAVNNYVKNSGYDDDWIEPCSPEQRWQSPTTYAVMKAGRKSAVRVFETAAAAQAMARELGGKHTVEVRQGESKRCENYCLVKDWCNYYNSRIKK